ncbi:centriole duplication and spindle assembly protein centrobin isoform 2-T2 [Glossina fuscipes fuscipes]
MSDSDDTDILLLIPPNYYLTTAEERIAQQELQEAKAKQYTSLQELNALERQFRCRFRRNLSRDFQAMDLANTDLDSLAMPPPAPPPTTAAYQFLSTNRKAELNNINTHLHNMEHERGGNLENPSDISSISTCTVLTQFGHSKANRDSGVGIIHSTPKCNSSVVEDFKSQNNNANVYKDYPAEEVLMDIDKFLSGERADVENPYNGLKPQNDDLRQSLQTDHLLNQSKSLPSAVIHERVQNFNCSQMSKMNDNLISLSEIWGKNGQATAIAIPAQQSLKEEQLRRQHLEKMVRQLQASILEYQQRLSVAVEVDRAKDSALNDAQRGNQNLTQDLQQMRQNLQIAELQRKQHEEKMDGLQKELAQAVSLATKFQEKTEKLENELTNCSRKTNESHVQFKQQIEELEIKIHACQRSEELAINELHKIKDKYAKSEHLYEKTKLRYDELEREISTLRHQKEVLQDVQQKQKSRADLFENQKKSLQDAVNRLTEAEASLKRKMDLQQKTLKSHYQQQLETVVTQKLREFQEQLDKTEDSLKAEAKERERLIAERAVKQLELINEKNEQELNLLQEKHHEEVELYRIQLANASKKIDELEMKLNLYKSKRADIAEKLHNVMETQWQKALEILTSPTQSKMSESDTDSPESNDTNRPVNHAYNECTPKSSRKENNLNVQNNKAPTLSPMDRLQAYIELLLSKSPGDFDKLDEILALTTKAKQAKEKMEKNAKRHCHNKPPWKA